MKTLWFRELKPYSAAEISEKFGRDADSTIAKLLAANILRPASFDSKNKEEADIEELLELAPDGDSGYAFNFCGVVYVNGLLIRCYPKYIRNGTWKQSFPLVMQAIKRYNKHREQRIYSVQHGGRNRDILGIIRAVLEDYAHHGLYRTKQHEYELNGQGETDWQRTIERHQPAFIHRENKIKPVYINRDTDRVKTDEGDFFRQVQMAVLEQCSHIIRQMQLQNLFPVRGIRFPGIRLRNLGHKEYILRRLRQEYARQFAEIKRQTLSLLIIFIEQMADTKKSRPVVFFGTNAMNLVWEKALAEVLNNQLDKEIRNIKALPEDKRRTYEQKDKKLIDIIERPVWRLYDDEKRSVETQTLKPDTIAINEHGFVIYDAKYYVPKVGQRSISHQPGLESVTKQYLYQMAYQDFLKDFCIKNVKNVFLLPGVHNEKIASVEFRLLRQYTGKYVEAFFVDADSVWKNYVEGRKLAVDWMF